MSTEEPTNTQIVWSPDDLPAAEAEALQAKEQRPKKRVSRAKAVADGGVEGAAPAKKRRTRTVKAKEEATPVASEGSVPKTESTAPAKSEGSVPKSEGAAPAKPEGSVPMATKPVVQPQPVTGKPEGTVPQSEGVAPAKPEGSVPSAAKPMVQPQVATGSVPKSEGAVPAKPNGSVPAAAAQTAQQGEKLAPEGPQQPLSRRQLRRQQWLANRAQRMGNNGNRGNFNNNGNQAPQGNRRPMGDRPQQQQRFEPQQVQVPRNPDLPEYRLQDIHSWDNGTIVQRMMPDANAEDLGAMKRHEIIFAAIRNYLSRGGAVRTSGCLKVEKEGYGFLRSSKTNFLACPEDVFIPQQQIRRHSLRTGDIVEGPIRDPRDKDRYFVLGSVVSVNGKTPSEAARIVHFENLTPTFPTRRIVLETEPGELSTRVVDIFTPIGFGQRGLIVAPPRVGKTVLLQKMANAITKNHPDAILIVLLIDERPEEVTDMQRNTKAMVLSSTFDEEPQHHVDVADMVIEMSRRQAENGKDVVILLDSITRLARAYNTVQPHSGKILTGGVDALALHRPKRFFGAARNIEGGGSLTILATALIDTGSRMDEVIFEEFKGTGNMELVLDRGLADRRIFPAIDIEKSGTRKEDLLLAPLELEKTWALRRVLTDAGPERAMQSVLAGMKKFKSNPEFLLSLDLKNL
ncbi:MAG: transcription termination factor Rho [Kiritimatiellae bacterium]|nr:transcription termination factor Rho [Kiritimatiellia bacterium]